MASLTGSTTAVFFVRLSTAVDEIVDVDWNTRDGTAIAGQDYEAASGTVSFLPGETEKAIDVVVYGQDDVSSNGKKFYIELKPPANAVLTDALAECVITVADEDGVLVTSLVIAQGKRGLKGNPGLSAYEQAVLMGYEGTVEDWMQEQADAAAAAQRASDYAANAAAAATKAENAATAASLIGNIFPTPEAGVDTVTGVQNGAYYNVRSTEDDSYLVEYQNVGGVPTPSGKSYPSSSALGNIQHNNLKGRDVMGAHPASAILDSSGLSQQGVNDLSRSWNIKDLSELQNLLPLLSHAHTIVIGSHHADGSGLGGAFIYSSSLPKSLHDGGLFIDPDKVFPADWSDRVQQEDWFNVKNTGTGILVRKPTGLYTVEMWGIKADGLSEEDIALNAIVQSIPEGATLHMIERTCTILVDAPAGQLENPCAWGINKKIKIIGTVGCTVKIKDFCSAWTNFTTTLDVVQITASGAEVLGLRVDANSDNHYQLDSNGFKWWEAAPSPLVPKRPPNGIVTRCKTGQPNVKDVVMAFNTVLRPLAGIAANGAYGEIYSQEFYDKTLSVGCVQNVKAFGNTVIRARGNDLLMSNGALDCHFYNNQSQLGYYHYQRLYHACIGCQMTNNDALYNYSELANLYNSSDNGYWRTSDTANPKYKIVRSGVRIGSLYVGPNENGGNIRDSFISGGTIRYNGGLNAIMDESSTQAAAASLQNVGYNCEIFGVTVYDGPANTSVFINTGETTTPPQGCAIRGNEYYRCRVGVIIQSDNATFSGNKLTDCSIVDTSHIITAVKENPRVYDNEIFFTAAQPNSRRILSVTTATTGLIDNNRTKNIRPQVLISDPNAQIFGSNAKGAKINLVSNYTEVADSRINTVSNSLINLIGEISSTNATSVIASFDTVFRPMRDQKFAFIVVSAGTETTVGEVFVGTVTTLGQFRIDLKGKVNIGTLSFNFNYPSNFIS